MLFVADVLTIPENGTWFQLIGNGTTTVNNGPNGLQRLDTVIRLAEKHGIFVQLALTNNWNPLPLIDDTTTGLGMISRDVTKGTNNSFPRNTLSNDYGQLFINYLAFKLKVNVQEEWIPTSELSVILTSTIMMSSIQTRRFLINSRTTRLRLYLDMSIVLRFWAGNYSWFLVREYLTHLIFFSGKLLMIPGTYNQSVTHSYSSSLGVIRHSQRHQYVAQLLSRCGIPKLPNI